MSLILDGTNGLSDVDGTAATPAIRGTDTNTGIYFGSDVIGFSEGGTQCGEFDASANFKFNSGYGSVATAFGCRAWITFTVSGGTPSIAGSGNISSITDNGAGDFTFNFSANMPNTNYCVVGVGTGGGANYQIFGGNQGSGFIKSVGSLRAQFGYVNSVGGSLANQDPASAELAFFR
jgi:hypothetical protein